MQTNPPSGWIADSDTWVYVSATSFKIAGKDVRARFPVGTKIKLTQTSVKYFYVVATGYSTDTIVTVTGGSDYSLANAAISSPCYSYDSNPRDFPHWFNWTPTLTGYSSPPTGGIYRFRIEGRTVYFAIREPNSGTSNSAQLRVSVPVTPRNITNLLWLYPAALENGGSVMTTYGRAVVAGTSTDIVFGINPATQDGFTTSGGKRVAACEGWYEI